MGGLLPGAKMRIDLRERERERERWGAQEALNQAVWTTVFSLSIHGYKL